MHRILIVFVVLLVAGCKGNDIVGKYKMQATMPAGKADDPSAAMANSLMSMMVLELKADKTFTMAMGMEGTYAVSGDIVELTPTKFLGMDASKVSSKPGTNKTMRLRIEDGGKSLVPINDNPKPGAPKDAKFVRQ